MIFLSLLCGFAQAEEVSAKELYYNAVSLAEDGEYELAIEAFKVAYAASQKHVLLYNIAHLYEELDQYEQAIDYLNKYRIYAPEEERATLQEEKQRLQKLLEEQKEQEQEKVEQEKIEQEKIEQERLAAEQKAKESQEEAVVNEGAKDDELTPKESPAWHKPASLGLGSTGLILMGTSAAMLYSLDKAIRKQCQQNTSGAFDCVGSIGALESQHRSRRMLFFTSVGMLTLSPVPLILDGGKNTSEESAQ